MNTLEKENVIITKIKPMPLLLIEDEIAECRMFKECAYGRADIDFIGMTDSSEEAMKIVKSRLPEGVILDLELTKGSGTGLEFLAELKNANLALRPIVIVTTNIQSEVIYDRLHNLDVSFIFSKKQAGYNVELILNTMVGLRVSLPFAQNGIRRDLQTIESPAELKARILERIELELNLVGISLRLKGREYLREAIYLLINKEKDDSAAVFYEVAAIKNINYNSVIRAVQTAVGNAWDSQDLVTLQQLCPIHVDLRIGMPPPTEFIHYYADKIRRTL